MNSNETHLEFYDFLREYSNTSDLILADEGELHFFRGEADEFYMGLRNYCSYPCVVGEGFSNDYYNSGNGIEKHRNTAFAVIDGYSDTDDYDQLDEVFAKCEIIGDDILRKLIQEYRKSNCLLKIDDIKCIQIDNRQERWAGLRYEITISSFWG